MISLINTLLMAISLASAKSTDFHSMKTQFEKGVDCRIKVESADAKAMVKAVSCYSDILSNKLSDKEQTGLSLWFVTLKSVKKIYSCTGEKYQLYTYPEYTPNFICVELTEGSGKSGEHLIFFDKEEKEFKISNIYTPASWDIPKKKTK